MLPGFLPFQGLWGAGSAFSDFEAFLDSMKKRGVSFLEMLSMVRAPNCKRFRV